MKITMATLALSITMIGAVSCSRQKVNDQERKREQQVADAAVLRSQYEAVAGDYKGTMKSQNGADQAVLLTLSVQDVPTDTGLTQKITGGLRIIVGSVEDGEFIDAAIQSSEYFTTQKRLTLVISHAQIAETILNLVLNENQLAGTWTAPGSGTSGTAEFQKGVSQ